MATGQNSGSISMKSGYSITDYYVSKGGFDIVTHLGSSSLFSTNFKKAASNYFRDCPDLVKKIQNREFKKKDIEEVVKYYNEVCE